MSRYEEKVSNKYLPIGIILVILVVIAIAVWLTQKTQIDDNIKTKAIEIPHQNIMFNDEGNKKEQEKIATSVATRVNPSQSGSEKKPTESPTDRLNINPRQLTLKTSDKDFKTAVGSVSESLVGWFKTKGMVKKFIVLVNDFSQKQIPFKHRAFIKPPGKIKVLKDAKGLYLAKESYKRFDFLVDAITAINLQKSVDLYTVFKPLFEKVYQQFSYPTQYKLDDIFLKAAANVIEAPVIKDRIYLLKHTVSYKFVKKEYEALSDVEKLMIRMGPENTKKIQAKLRKLVESIAALKE
jgi:hypothetical protein